MSGHGQITRAADGTTVEVIKHNVQHALADWLTNTAALYAALQLGIPQRIMGTNDGPGMTAAKSAAVFEGIVQLKMALARAGIQLPATMYGGGAAGY